MPTPIIQVEGLSKRYRLGQIGMSSLRDSVERWVGSGKQWMRGLRTSTAHPLDNRQMAGDASELWALRDVSFDVQQGDIVGIIGRNGAGKSTLLKILSRITEPTCGRAVLRGRTASLLEVGTGFHPELSGRDNVFLNGALLGMRKAEIARKFDEIVAFAEVNRFIDTPVKRYSSGMYVRLAFAVAAHLEPEILIVDEVLAVGDAQFQRKCLGKISAVSREGRTILFVSHNLPALQNLCGRTIVLRAGHLVFDGSTAEAIANYLSSRDDSARTAVDLRHHVNRLPGMSPFFTDIEVRVNGQPSTTPLMGEGLEIRVRYEAHRPLSGLRIGITINDRYQQRLANFSPSHQDPLVLQGAPRAGEVVCRIPSMNFVANTYFITVISADNAGEIDRVEDCCRIEVLPGDVFGTGRSPTSQHGVVYLPAAWSASWSGDAALRNDDEGHLRGDKAS